MALNETEEGCLNRFCALLAERLGRNLVRVRMFGSAARGDMWPAGSPMHSDIDLLVVTREPVAGAVQEDLLNETYPLYLECGRQLSRRSSRWSGSTRPRASARETSSTRSNEMGWTCGRRGDLGHAQPEAAGGVR